MAYIDRDELKKKLNHEFNFNDNMPETVENVATYKLGVLSAVSILENTPTHIGYWRDGCPVVSDGSLWKSFECSECDNRVFSKTSFCSHCGAEMVDEDVYKIIKDCYQSEKQEESK